MSVQPEIYFHVGLGKVASTYLQYEVFPKLEGIHYVQRTRYRHYPEILAKAKFDRYLLSREFDRQFETEVTRFASRYPDTGIIIALRRHDSWMASQYRRYVKNGGSATFGEFLDLDTDQGLWKKEDVYFFPKLKMVDELFVKKPLVLFHDDLKRDPWAFIARIAAYTGTTYDRERISLTASHTSYTERQLKFMRKVAQRLFAQEGDFSPVRPLRWIQKRTQLLKSYAVLHGSRLLPDSMIPEAPLITPEELTAVRNYFEDDWRRCLEYAAETSEHA